MGCQEQKSPVEWVEDTPPIEFELEPEELISDELNEKLGEILAPYRIDWGEE